MENCASPREVASRRPLGDATDRVNNTNPDLFGASLGPPIVGDINGLCSPPPGKPAHSTVRVVAATNRPEPSENQGPATAVPSAVAANPRVSAISQEDGEAIESRRVSQVSTVSSTSSKGKTKSYIGPWQLGKTLGKGSSARVRAARHRLTHQPVAVKIVPKRVAHITQAGSLAKLDQIDRNLPEDVDGVRRMPLTIEREVAILKLIEHPNIVKLYDIWENRQEIYLILEYVEKGDLFEYINSMGRINEEDAIFVFRQMMSAVEYCHSYNICHRDLKPENILLKSDGQIKIADFGMAALHQGPEHQLRTSCGSPHYAAPELLKARTYRGDKSDIWSMGVILFAMLAARLPFDDENLHVMLSKAKKAQYDMPEFFGKEAKDLIRRILQVEPDVRISMQQMWKHPLIKKYDFVDDLGRSGGKIPNVREGKQMTPLDPNEIDPQTLRQLRSMWHTFSEKDLVAKLISNEVNDQKLFYWLLHNYREKQLENYNPTLTYSGSDYHHLKPSSWTKQVSTRQFTQRKANGHGRSFSRFTVISNVAETEVGTVRSYDPFKASQVLHPCNSQVSHAKITIHRDDPDAAAKVASLAGSQSSRPGAPIQHRKRRNSQLGGGTTGGRIQSPKGSMGSIQSTPHVRAKGRYRRGVDFSNVRKQTIDHRQRSIDQGGRGGVAGVAAGDHPVNDDGGSPPRKTRKTQEAAKEESSSTNVSRPGDRAVLFNEELRHFSTSIANHCDEAFRSSLVSSDSIGRAVDFRDGTPFSLILGTPVAASTPTCITVPTFQARAHHPWDSRPLPPSPPRPSSESLLLDVVQAAQGGSGGYPASKRPDSRHGKESHEHATIGGSQDSQRQQQQLAPVAAERRTVSAPVYAQYSKASRPLPSINENSPENWKQYYDSEKSRTVSAPPKSPEKSSAAPPTPHENRDLQFLARSEKTIRVVTSPTAAAAAARSADMRLGPVVMPAPLNVRKMPATVKKEHHHATEVLLPGLDLRQRYAIYEEGESGRPPNAWADSEMSESTTGGGGPRKKKSSSWFRRASKEDVDDTVLTAAPSQRSAETSIVQQQQPARTESQSTCAPPPPVPVPVKKKSFVLNLFKHAKHEQHRMSLAGTDLDDKDATDSPVLQHKKSVRTSHNASFDTETSPRKIEPQQNWLARLFRVKPATRYLCVTISRRRARQEMAILLREWRKYGIRDVEVDKERDIVFARVGPKNFLNMKAVAFAAEIITVIEHGKRNHLAIVRFTQEKGAASSFHRVVDTINTVFTSRSLQVADKRRAKMMLKTLNS